MKPRRLQRLRMNKTTVRNSEGQGGRSLISRFMHVHWYGDPRFFHERVTFIFRWCKGIAVRFFFSKILPREKMTAALQITGLQTVSGISFRSPYQWGSAELNHITRPGSDNQLFMSRTHSEVNKL